MDVFGPILGVLCISKWTTERLDNEGHVCSCFGYRRMLPLLNVAQRDYYYYFFVKGWLFRVSTTITTIT